MEDAGAHPEAAGAPAALPVDENASEDERRDEVTPTRPAAASAIATLAAAVSPPAADRYNDADLDCLALKLDAQSRQLRADLLAHMADCQRRAEERQREAVSAAVSSAAQELAEKQQELARTAAELERQREVLRRTGGVLFKAMRWRRQHTLGCMAWRAWREQAARQRRIGAHMAAAAKHYEEGKLRRGVFQAWRATAISQLRLRVKAQAAAALQAEGVRIWEEANASGAQQAKRLAEVEAALATALEERARLEENMKRAFMRGVCALNLEAMALMKGGVLPQAGQPATSLPAPQALPEQWQVAGSAAAGCVASAGQQAGENGKTADVSMAEQHDQQQLRQQLRDKLLQQGADSSATGWAIGATGLRLPAAALASTGLAPSALTAGMEDGGSGGSTARAYSMPAPEQPRPLITLAPAQPVPPLPRLPSSAARAVERHSGAGIRPGTAAAVPCSLPSNVPPHMAAAAGACRAAASPGRPATAPTRRQHAAASVAPQQQQGQRKQQQQQVSRRSLAGQARAGNPLVVRGAAGTAAGQHS